MDRLGRRLQDLPHTLSELQTGGHDRYLHHQAIDTRTPSSRAMFQVLGVFAEFEWAMIEERVRAGLARAREGARSQAGPSTGRGLQPAWNPRSCGSDERAAACLRLHGRLREMTVHAWHKAWQRSGGPASTVGCREQLDALVKGVELDEVRP